MGGDRVGRDEGFWEGVGRVMVAALEMPLCLVSRVKVDA